MHERLGVVSKRDELALQAAVLYYIREEKMEAIASQLNMSRSSVSRLLSYAKEVGLVRIQVQDLAGARTDLEREIAQAFHVNAVVVPVSSVDTPVATLESVAQVAAAQLANLMQPGATLGIAWGNTTAEVTRHLARTPLPNVTVVQLNGAGNAAQSGVPYAGSIMSRAAEAFGGQTVYFPVPAFFDYADTKEALWRERSIRQVLTTIESSTVALFGVGSLDAALPSHVYSGGYLDATELHAARADGVVGDVWTVLIREDGSTNMELNHRASGPMPDVLRRIPVRLCVVSGVSKAIPLLGALRAGVMTHLVVDSEAARALLNRMNREHGQRSSR